MKKRKLNTNVLAIFVVAVSVLLFAAAFSIAPYWNDQKLTDNSIDINKIITELEPYSQDDAQIAEFVNSLKNAQNNGELASYSMVPGATPMPTPTQSPNPTPNPNPIPTPTPTPGKCISGVAGENQMCGIGLMQFTNCSTCLTCTKPMSYTMPYPPYYTFNYIACGYKTGQVKDNCDNNCPTPAGGGWTRQCSQKKIVSTNPPIWGNPSCWSYCKDESGCSTCELCSPDNEFSPALKKCTGGKNGRNGDDTIKDKTTGYPRCSSKYKYGVPQSSGTYTCMDGACVKK